VGDRAPGPLSGRTSIDGPSAATYTAVGPADAPAVVFIHGTRVTRGAWWPQLRRLRGELRCIALDLPGHGAAAGIPFTLESAADRVAAIVDEAAGGSAVLVGLSLGGYVAMETAARHPDRVRGLVLAGCSADPFGPVTIAFRILAWILERIPQEMSGRINAWWFRARFQPAIAEPIVERGFWPIGGAMAVRSLLGRRFRDRLASFPGPVLFINGALDPVFRPRGAWFAAGTRSGSVELLARATHLSNLDAPGPFADAVRRFVRSAEAERAVDPGPGDHGSEGILARPT
jgi:pimeloyl-ACP methyl ester carboxylesterase